MESYSQQLCAWRGELKTEDSVTKKEGENRSWTTFNLSHCPPLSQDLAWQSYLWQNRKLGAAEIAT